MRIPSSKRVRSSLLQRVGEGDKTEQLGCRQKVHFTLKILIMESLLCDELLNILGKISTLWYCNILELEPTFLTLHGYQTIVSYVSCGLTTGMCGLYCG